MEQTYVIGNYRCRSKEEYDAIQSDFKKISLIKQKYDCDNPQVAEKLLNFFENHPNAFSSVLGKKFIERLKKIVEESKQEKYFNAFPEKVVSSDGKKEATIVTTNNQTVAKVRRTDTEYDITQYYIPLDIPAYTPKDKLYAVILSVLTALIPLIASLDFSFFFSANTDYDTYLSTMSTITLIPLMIWMFIIGCCEFSRIDAIGKEVARVKKELEKEENGSKGDSIGEFLLTVLLVIVLVALMVAIPPLVLIFMFIKACMSAAPKLKWLAANGKYFFYGLLFYGYVGAMAESVISGDAQMSLYSMIGFVQNPNILISIEYFVITYIIFRFVINKKTYKTIRTICAIPVMILMILLPFALVGLAAYAMYSEDSPSPTETPTEAVPVGVHEVQGHLRHLSNGTVVYVRPHLRTNPDGILSNNFSYNG